MEIFAYIFNNKSSSEKGSLIKKKVVGKQKQSHLFETLRKIKPSLKPLNKMT